MNEADAAAQRAVAESADTARFERGLSEIRAEIEAIKAESERRLREAAGK